MDKKLLYIIIGSVAVVSIAVGVGLIVIQKSIDGKAVTNEDRALLRQIRIR